MSAAPIQKVLEQAGNVILGKQKQIRLAVACLLARGHLLIEDVPGVGKTSLAKALSASIDKRGPFPCRNRSSTDS